jgi:alpha-tubulin suppressor-like RCC1 family protein
VKVVKVENAKAVVANGMHGCALLADGTIKCWGYNSHGQLGNKSQWYAGCKAASLVLGDWKYKALDAGVSHTCAVKTGGTVACWGSNYSGQVGVKVPLGDLCQQTTACKKKQPMLVAGLTDATTVALGSKHTCATKSDGTVACWGKNADGKLGVGTKLDQHTPSVVLGLAGVTAITCGHNHTCALKADGNVVCWGANDLGQLGDGAKVSCQKSSDCAALGSKCGAYKCLNGECQCVPGKLGPKAVKGLAGATAITANGNHSCALKTDGSVSCWGRNDKGQLGDGTLIDRSEPVPVKGLSKVTAIAAGDNHTCAILQSGAMSCWGDNQYGQHGDGTTNSKNTPTP